MNKCEVCGKYNINEIGVCLNCGHMNADIACCCDACQGKKASAAGQTVEEWINS